VAGDVTTPAALEWPATLSVPDLMADGWRPTPFRQFVLKVHSRCNLACDYCYVYRHADQGWRAQPTRMSVPTLTAAAERIATHARAHRLPSVQVVLHGGEPLLAGRGYLAGAVRLLRRVAAPDVDVVVGLQTNGTLLDPEFLAEFRAGGVRVGVSVDGAAAGHDRHRRYASGTGSHAPVAAALRLLARPENRPIYAGLLCTVDPANDPVATYRALLDHDPPAVDFLLPHGNWSAPPPGRTPDPEQTPYADWLIAAFDEWYAEPVLPTRVRLFEEIIHLLLGGGSATEAVGLTPTSMVVVETDGSIEQSDMLKSAYPGAAVTGLHVARDPFDAALRLPSIAARQLGAAALGEECRRCPVRRVCGGGLYPHRYRAGTGFRNPSVYCADLYRLIGHIRARVAADVGRLAAAPV
jgi:uncharacterized protein